MGQYYSVVTMALWLMGAAGWVEGGRATLIRDDGACSPPLFVFGASYMDVGQNAAAMPFRGGADRAPYGLDYFDGKPSGRFSNGRLIIDHISQGLGQDLLSPYLRDVGSGFRHGVNFASAGSTARNSSFAGDGSDSSGLFSLSVQIDQFRVFHNHVLAVLSLSNMGREGRLPAPEDFSRGVYIIESGGNDYSYRIPGFQVDEALISLALESIEDAVRNLFLKGARTIVVMDAFPRGCYPDQMWKSAGPAELDDDGCWIPVMKVVERHNERLRVMIFRLNMELPGANLVIFSLFDVFLSAIRNPSQFGLKYVQRACCGYGGGNYNYNTIVQCSHEGIIDGQLHKATVCENRSEYMLWDSLHPTDAFSFYVAQAFINGEHMQPPFYIKQIC